MHDNWMLHRDLKASNLLLSHGGILKIADFGLARDYGSPLKPYTPVVVTLWYRSPELLLGIKKYSTAIDMWSVGCLFGEFLQMKPLFQGKSEYQQLTLIFQLMGIPTEKRWPGYKQLPLSSKMKFDGPDGSQLKKRFMKSITERNFDKTKYRVSKSNRVFEFLKFLNVNCLITELSIVYQFFTTSYLLKLSSSY